MGPSNKSIGIGSVLGNWIVDIDLMHREVNLRARKSVVLE